MGNKLTMPFYLNFSAVLAVISGKFSNSGSLGMGYSLVPE